MVLDGRRMLPRFLLFSSVVALLVFLSSYWLPQGGGGDCGAAWHPCLSFYSKMPEPQSVPKQWVELTTAPPLLQECSGQSFQVWRLLLHLRSCVTADGDVVLEPYLQSWNELVKFMESLGTIVSFFSQKVKVKVALIQELSLKHSAQAQLSARQTPAWYGESRATLCGYLCLQAYRSLRSMMEAELKAGLVDFYRRTDSGCRTLLRLHRSLLWLKLLLEGLAEGADTDGRHKTPGELSREAYRIALAPHHSWILRQAAELVFLALPDRKFFFQLVCVQSQLEATPKLHTIIQALAEVHTHTHQILQDGNMLELP
ncbi:ceramide-1-phosphate transfer protein-like [Genypterus blacodes]|uniref:ceramide-1-phosphate transfer protein-like n=1 Tax=Genypterus blacodes TaxID=154954 RepID=UPI003F76D5F4